MATRFYLPSTGTPAISPAFGGGWSTTTNADRRSMVRTRINSAMANKDGAGTAADNEFQLLRQYISEALAAQTITGAIKGQVRGIQNGGANAFTLGIRVAKCSSDGSSVTEILSIQRSTTIAATPPAFVSADTLSLTNRRFEQGVDDFSLELSSTGVSAGDCLIVEIGYWDISTNAGRFGSINFGDDAASDLPENETATAADNPWVEFSMDISFGGGGGSSILRQMLQHYHGGPQ